MATLEQKKEYYRKVRASNYEASCRLEGIYKERKELKGIKVELLDYMGSDLAVVDAARVSFNKTSTWAEVPSNTPDNKPEQVVGLLKESDVKLIKFLAAHDHWTPFAHTALKFRVAAPVPIRTQC